ncbi:MAG: helix-turn-helix domain-containing protein [Emcibacter sp.]|nr:helix-turn-helix domain-containing protein [Emcibacter sp.]
MATGKKYTIGKLSELSGCVIQTIRYYEQISLLPEPDRSPRGHRLYNNDLLARLKFILRLRQLGYNLEKTRDLLNIVDGGKYTCQQIKKKTLQHAQTIHDKITDLKKIETELLKMAAQCNDDKGRDCSILDSLFHT